MKLARVGAAIAAVAIVAAACSGSSSSGKTIKIGISLPLSGSSLASAGPARDGALLAIKEANAAGTVKGYTLTTDILDHSVNGQYDAQQGAKDMTTLVSDSNVMAVVGPFNSAVAKVQIPISNQAGLLQCSPANTNPDLTKGDPGKQLRAANPDKINYIRVATTDDIQGPAVAQYAYNDLGLKNVAIVDDLSVYGKGIADAFSAEFTKLGGKIADREGADPKTTDYSSILTKFAGLKPDSVFFGGVTANGGGLLRKQMPQAGLGDAAVPRRRRHPGPERRRRRLVHQHRRCRSGQLVVVGRRDPRHPERGRLRRQVHGRVQDGPGRLQRVGLRLRPDHHPGAHHRSR